MKLKPLFGPALVAAAVTLAPGARAGSIVNDLVVHLTFDGTYENAAPGSTVAAAPIGAVSFEAGRIGSGAVHVSSDRGNTFFNYVTLGNPAALNFGGSTDFSISMWVKLNSWNGDPSLISNKDWNSGGNTGYVLATDTGGNLQWNYTESTSTGRVDYDGPAGTFSDGQWHNVIVSYDRDGNALTFVDGVLANTAFIGPASETIDSGLNTNIGQDGTGAYGGNGIDAFIDDVAIWRRAIDASDAAGIYRAGTNGLSVQTVADPAGPVLLGVTPPNGAIDVKTDAPITASIRDGTVALAPGSVQFTLNGSAQTMVPSKTGIYTTLSYTPAPPLANKTLYTAQLIYGDGVSLFTNIWQFTTVGAEQAPGITGQWDFDAGSLGATIGTALAYFGGDNGDTAKNTQFGTTTSFGIPDINGIPANVVRFPGANNNQIGYVMTHGAVPNGAPNATRVNRWTLIYDILITEAAWFSFIQIDSPSNGNDGDLFINPGGGIGISGSYQGTIRPLEWHRVAFACDFIGEAPVISKFIDGVKVSDQTRTAPQQDGRHTLLPTAILFADEDGESQPAYINSVQVRNYKMSDAEIAALGGPSADGIPTVSGQWDFEGGVAAFADGLKATIGADLRFMPGTEFDTTFDNAVIGGTFANVMRFGGTAGNGYFIPHGGLPNGGGLRVNQYSLVLDLFYPASSTGYRAIWQTDTNAPTGSDADLFVNPGNGIGISSQYQGNVAADQWHRVAFTFDLTKRELGKYLNGTNVLRGPVGATPPGTGPFQYLSASSGIVDNRYSLGPLAELFSDEDGEMAPVLVNSVQFRPVVLTADEIRRLGTASAAGIPLQIPADLKIYSITKNEFSYTVRWAGGKPPYRVQVRTSLSSGVWEDYRLPTTDTFMEIENIDIDGPNAFIRVLGQ